MHISYFVSIASRIAASQAVYSMFILLFAGA